MRETKFRLIKDNKIVGYEMWLDDKWVYRLPEQELFSLYTPFISHDKKDYYTGLKDKNGVEIYEVDIVKAHSHKPTNFKIEFIEGGFCATRNGIEYPIDINHFYPSIGCTIEVIGNIYEHPHLLGGE